MANFLALGHYDALIRRMRIEYAERHRIMKAALDREDFHIAGEANFGGICFWIEGPEGLDADAFADALPADGVLIESGAPFFADRSGPCRYFRMAYSSIAASRIEAGLRITACRLRERA